MGVGCFGGLGLAGCVFVVGVDLRGLVSEVFSR